MKDLEYIIEEAHKFTIEEDKGDVGFGVIMARFVKSYNKKNIPDLTHVWNHSVDRKDITAREVNDIWGAIKTLKKYGYAELTEMMD